MLAQWVAIVKQPSRSDLAPTEWVTETTGMIRGDKTP